MFLDHLRWNETGVIKLLYIFQLDNYFKILMYQITYIHGFIRWYHVIIMTPQIAYNYICSRLITKKTPNRIPSVLALPNEDLQVTGSPHKGSVSLEPFPWHYGIYNPRHKWWLPVYATRSLRKSFIWEPNLFAIPDIFGNGKYEDYVYGRC